jgi:hypothetical protein
MGRRTFGNSKGQAEMLEWIPRLLMMLVAIIVIAMLVRYFALRDIDTPEMSRAAYVYRLYYDPNLLIVTDDATGRAYPGVIDIAKFTSARIDAVYGVNGKISSALTLTGPCVPGEKHEITIYHDKDTYDKNIGFARFGTIGPGGSTIEERLLPVTIAAQTRCYGILNITAVRPNT